MTQDTEIPVCTCERPDPVESTRRYPAGDEIRERRCQRCDGLVRYRIDRGTRRERVAQAIQGLPSFDVRTRTRRVLERTPAMPEGAQRVAIITGIALSIAYVTVQAVGDASNAVAQEAASLDGLGLALNVLPIVLVVLLVGVVYLTMAYMPRPFN